MTLSEAPAEGVDTRRSGCWTAAYEVSELGLGNMCQRLKLGSGVEGGGLGQIVHSSLPSSE